MVYINGNKLNEPYIKPDRRDDRTMGLADIPPRNTYTRIPKDMYLMMPPAPGGGSPPRAESQSCVPPGARAALRH